MNRQTFALTLVFLTSAAAAALLVNNYLFDVPTMPTRGIAAHRGAATTHPENTLPALQAAIDLGVHQIEWDVRWTSDQQLVLMHDRTLKRTTNVAEIFPGREEDPVDTFSLAELSQLDAGAWKDPEFAGTRIPTLADALKAMPSNVWLNLDLKVNDPQFGQDVAYLVLAQKREHQAILSAKTKTAQGISDVEEATLRNLLINNMQNQGTDSAYVEATINGGFEFLQFYGDPFPSSADIRRLKDQQIRINYFHSGNINASTLSTWLDQGIDFPLVDNVAEAIQHAEKKGISRLQPAWSNDF